MPEENESEEVDETVIEGGEENSTEQKNDSDNEGADNKGESKEAEEEFKDDLAEPVVRKKTNADWVAERRGKKIEKMKDQQNKDESKEEGAEEEEEDVDEEDAKVVRKILKEELGPVINPILAEKSKAEDDIEIGKVLAEHPEFKPYEEKVRRFMAHPSRKNLPVETVFADVIGVKTLLQLGAKKGLSAEEKANEGRTGGGSNTSTHKSKAEEIQNMSHEEFEQYKASIR